MLTTARAVSSRVTGRLVACRLEPFFYWATVAGILGFTTSLDRTYLIDQQNYLDDFATARAADLIDDVFSAVWTPDSLVRLIFSEEIGWRSWTCLLGAFLPPELAVLGTSVLTSVLIAIGLSKLKHRIAGLSLWALLPVALPVSGVIQIRMGLAFGILLALSIRARMPVLAAATAAMFHTTFVVVLAFVVISRLLRHWRLAQLLVSVTVAASAAWLGGLLFEAFGGRRLAIYSATEGSTSLNLALGGLVCLLPSLSRVWNSTSREAWHPERSAVDALALAHIGSVGFIVCSTLLFPLGASRVTYFMQMMLVPVLAAPLAWQLKSAPTTLPLVGYLFYLISKTFLEGGYSIFALS